MFSSTRVKSSIASIASGYKSTLANSSSKLVCAHRMLTAHAVVFSDHGEPAEALSTHTYEIDENNLDANSIIVKTLGSPVNPSDINQVQGVYPSQPEKTTALGTDKPSAVGGNEGLFEVIHVGSAVKDFEVGDWAVPAAVNFGTWRTHALCESSKMLKLPNPAQAKAQGKKQGLTVNQGATISVNPLTALLMLTHYVKLEPGKDWFIQNGGNSSVGTFATQIGRILGFHSISVIRDRPDLDETIEHLKKAGATHVITEEQNSSREFAAEVKKWVGETGGSVRLGFNCVGGKSSTAVARKLSQNGLMLSYGGMSYQPVIIPTTVHLFKNVTSSGFWVTQLLKNDLALKQKSMAQIVEWYQEGKLVDAKSTETRFEGGDLAQLYKDAVTNSKKGKQLVVY